MDGVLDDYMRRMGESSAEAQSRAVERMLILPGNLGARLYEWIDNTGYHNAVHLTDEVEHMTIELMPVGQRPD